MSKENVISKKEPFARMVKRDHISVGKAWAIRLIAVATGSSGTCDRGSHKTESDRSVSWNY